MSPYTFFVDRALGKSVGLALQGAGYNIEFHNAHFQPDCPDIEWLPVVSQREWIVLTKDNRISVNLSEILAIANHQARVFILSGQSLSTATMVDVFVNVIGKIERFSQGNQSPFIAKIYRPSRVVMWKSHRELEKLSKFYGSDL